MSRKELNLGTEHKSKLETYAEDQNINHSEAARRLIDHGIEYEEDPSIVDALVKESFTLSVFLTIVLSLFTMIDPAMLYFAIISSTFAIGIGLGFVYRTANVGFPWFSGVTK